MTTSFISNFIFRNLSLIQDSYETQAIELFGKDIADSLHSKAHSWKKLMKSWSTFYKACTVIKSSSEYFSNMPMEIYCNLQSNDGLIFHISRRTRYDLFDEGILITPFGYFDINFKTTQARSLFINNLQREFCTKLLEDTYRYKKYSFILSSNQNPSPTSFYNLCGFKQTDEIREDVFTQSHVNEICKRIKYLDLVIQECSNS